jgi:hypothetical protein
MHADGCLVHLGREDFQVKIRGHRVEVSEIETALLDHPGIKEAVVMAPEYPRGEKHLAAYLVASQKPTPSTSELRDALAVKLPDYMLPAVFVFLDALPLTPTGKVDRLALPMPDRDRGDLAATLVMPRTAVEEVVTGMWAEVLGLERIGVHDGFFDLGGHSLLATQMMSQINRIFQVELPLRRFFEAPTVAELAQGIIAHEAKPGQTARIAGILKRLKGMSAEDVTNMLQKKRAEQGEKP